MNKKLIDVQIEFFIPIWRRIGLVLFCSVWAGLEWMWDNFFWGMVPAIIAIYCFYQFFFAFDPKKE